MTTVADYMTPGPHTIGREQSLVAAKQMMQKIHARHLPVLHGGKLVGVLSDRELAAIETLPGSRQMTVEDAMVPDVYITSEDAPLATVAGEMARQQGRIRHRAQGRPRGRRVHAPSMRCGRSPRRSRRGRQRQREAGPAGARLDANRAAVVGDDPVNDRQAESRPLGLGREEGVEHGQLLAEARDRRPRRRSRPRRPRPAPRGAAGRRARPSPRRRCA